MDFLQIALVGLILLLAVMLTVLGSQVFFILKDLKKSLDKLDLILGEVEKPTRVAAEVAEVVEVGAKAVKKIIRETKSSRRLFHRSK
ncbi:hypothetical protein HY389_01800 [Candidatus Daviesbacteria bacterium]|nr:hypothetical protein [Candidatus Daviesbacteria bacterium]